MNYGDGGSGPGGVASATPWVVRFDPRPTAAVRLICLPHAGAGASMYLRWSRALPDWVEVVAVQLSGRETRRREPLRHAAGELVEDLAAGLEDELGGDRRPYALYGHSMGALLAFELARRLGDRAAPPVHLFVAAHVAPHLHGDVPATHLLPRDELVARLGAMGGTPSAVLDNTALMDHFLPIVRADLGLCADYVYDPTAGRFLTIPISAFGATSDPEVPVCAIGPWADLTRGPFRLRLIPGNHFFAARAPEQLMRAIEHDLASRVPCG